MSVLVNITLPLPVTSIETVSEKISSSLTATALFSSATKLSNSNVATPGWTMLANASDLANQVLTTPSDLLSSETTSDIMASEAASDFTTSKMTASLNTFPSRLLSTLSLVTNTEDTVPERIVTEDRTQLSRVSDLVKHMFDLDVDGSTTDTVIDTESSSGDVVTRSFIARTFSPWRHDVISTAPVTTEEHQSSMAFSTSFTFSDKGDRLDQLAGTSEFTKSERVPSMANLTTPINTNDSITSSSVIESVTEEKIIPGTGELTTEYFGDAMHSETNHRSTATVFPMDYLSEGSRASNNVADARNRTESITASTRSDLASFFQNVGQSFVTDAEQSLVSGDYDLSHNVTLTSIPLCELYQNCSSPLNLTEGGGGPPTGMYEVVPYDQLVDTDGAGMLAAKAGTLALLAAVGVAGNALVIWNVVRQRHLHRPPFYYLLSLSLTDLSRAAFCLPIVLMTLLQGAVWRHGASACDLFAFANTFFVLSSGVSLLHVAADRHLSLVYANSYRRRAGGVMNLVVVLLGWVLAFLVSFPPVVGVGAYAFEESEAQCALRHRHFRQDNDTLGFLMVFSTLSLLTLFLYYRIFLALRQQRRMRPVQHEPPRSSTWTFAAPGAQGQAFLNWANGFMAGQPTAAAGSHNPAVAGYLPRLPPRPNFSRPVSLHAARNQHVTRLFFFMTLAFNGLWLPYQVLSYWRVFGESAAAIPREFVAAAAWLSYGQVVICPLVYFGSRQGPAWASSSARHRSSRSDASPEDKQEYLLESLARTK